MKTSAKFCKNCGKIMWDVGHNRCFCDSCKKQKDNARRKENRKQAREKRTVSVHPATKPISQCVREAESLRLTYGQYVARGLDKEEYYGRSRVRKGTCQDVPHDDS